MALYDNQHWLLSHIRDSFIFTDDTSRFDTYLRKMEGPIGACEMVMLGEDLPKQLKANGVLDCYPGMEDSDDEDIYAMAESYDIQMDMEFGHRQRSNTAQRLEKMDLERKQAAEIKHVKWENKPSTMSVEIQSELFQRKDFRKKKETKADKRHSLLAEQLEKCPNLPQNPFTDYAKFDGSEHIGTPAKKYRIFMSMLPEEQRMYPMQIVVVATAKVQEFIGLICYKYAAEHPDNPLKADITKYGLYITEDDGEVDWDLPCLDPRETIAKFGFTCLGLKEMTPNDRARHNTVVPKTVRYEENPKGKDIEQKSVAEDMAMMDDHTTAMEAPLYQLYRVHIINKVRAKAEIHLGISGEKIEIDPVITGKGAARFWNRQRAVSYHIDNIAWCELVEHKGPKTTFTLVYTSHANHLEFHTGSSGQTPSLHQSTSFKNHDFEADSATAEEIVRKINHILEIRSGTSRKEYLAQRERKATRRKNFHLHR